MPFVSCEAPFARNSSGERISAITPEGSDALFFMNDYTMPEGMTIRGAKDGVTYLFPFQQGFVIEANGKLESVLGGLIDPAGYTSIDDVVADLRALGE